MSSNGGPATQDGKAAVRWNATRHGIRSPEPVIPGVESAEDYQSHRAGIMESVAPSGHLESTLAERVALMSWRLHRVVRYETETIALAQEKIEEDITSSRNMKVTLSSLPESDDIIHTGVHPEDVRYGLKWAKSRHNALKRFPGLAADKTMKEPSDVVWTVLMAAQDALAERIDVEELELPGVGEDEWIEELPPMKVANIRACVDSIARYVEADPETLLEAATRKARSQMYRAENEAESVEEDVSRKSRQRLLPDDKELEKIARYEAHLSRQLYQALHELESLQKRRLSGEHTPLARLDVNVAGGGAGSYEQ